MSLRKGAISRRGGLSTYEPTGLAPQQVVAGLTSNDATRDVYQRKVFYDGVNFFVVYFDLGVKTRYYVASADGITWGTPVSQGTFSVAPFSGGNLDCQFAWNSTLQVYFAYVGSNGVTSYIYRYTISGATLTGAVSAALSQGTWAHGGGLCVNPDSSSIVYVCNSLGHDQWGQIYPALSTSGNSDVSRDATHVTGGSALLPYKQSSPYSMFCLAKDASSVLQWNLLNPTQTNSWVQSFQAIATLGVGFSDFCGCSESPAAERVHLAYVKSTGQLCYRRFENDALGDETVLVASGASYPVIACGTSGRLYVFYVKAGKVWVMVKKGVWLSPVELFTKDHTYDAPIYLSSNGNVQSGKICLVWTEGASSPYSVWFCYLND